MQNFGTGTLFATAIQDSTGAAIANATPVQFGTLQDISGEFSFEEKKLYGSRQHPIAIARGKANFSFKAKVATFNGAILSDLIFGKTATAGIKSVVAGFATTIPASTPYTLTIAPPSTGTFLNDKGVLNAAGYPMTKVASSPTTGQYAVSALGVYTFAAADTGAIVSISYEYSASSTGSDKIITISNDLMGQAPKFGVTLNSTFNGSKLTFNFPSCTASKFSMPFKNDDFTIPEFDFSPSSDAANNVGYIYLSE